MTKTQRELARHALGLPNKQHESYRNRFITGPGSGDYEDWQQMVEDGDAEKHHSPINLYGGDDLFWLTKQGALKALDGREKLDPEDFE